MNKDSFALITGASGGIGLELAKIFAEHKINLVLTARSGDKLARLADELMTKHGVVAYVKTADLSIPDEVAALQNFILEKNIFIEYLVNNAGFGSLGGFHEAEWKNQSDMMMLNMNALASLTRHFVNDMIKHRRGRILNVASTAAFQPGPFMTVYYATKAFVLSFTEGIAEELRGTGVTVTALCPGPTHSGFMERADMQDSALFKTIPVATSAEVARFGFRAMMKGRTVAIQGLMNGIGVFILRFSPRYLVRKFIRRLNLTTVKK